MRHHEKYNSRNCTEKMKRPRIKRGRPRMNMNNLNKWAEMTNIEIYRTFEDRDKRQTRKETRVSDAADKRSLHIIFQTAVPLYSMWNI